MWAQPEGQKSKTASPWLLPLPQSEMTVLPPRISELRLHLRHVSSCLIFLCRIGIQGVHHHHLPIIQYILIIFFLSPTPPVSSPPAYLPNFMVVPFLSLKKKKKEKTKVNQRSKQRTKARRQRKNI